MLFISYALYYVSVEFWTAVGGKHMFKVTRSLSPKYIKSRKQCLWGILEIEWMEVNITLYNSKI